MESDTPEVSNEEFAKTLSNLGVAFYERIKGNRSENLEKAIQAYESALKVYLGEPFPQYGEIAMIKNNLGNAYANKVEEDEIANLNIAIKHYKDALEIHFRENFAQNWAAMVQNNLGTACREKGIRGNSSHNLEEAIGYYKAALSVYTREAFPSEYTNTLSNLALTYQKNNQNILSYNAFSSAIETVDFLCSEIVSGDESKQKLAEEYNKIYQQMVEVCLKIDKPIEALEYAERSKTRNLVEQILTRDLYTIFPPEVANQLRSIQNKITIDQKKIQEGKTDNVKTLAVDLQELRLQRNNLQNEYIPIASGFKFKQFQETLDNQTAIIEWYITSESIQTFIFTRHSSKPFILSSTKDCLKSLIDWTNIYLNKYYQRKNDWRTQLSQQLNDLSKILRLDEIIAYLPQECEQLIFVPHRYLHLVPLHALKVNQLHLIDLFPKGVSYSPSCQLLLQAQKRQRADFSNLFAVQNPEKDLCYADLEVDVITQHFKSVEILKKVDATLVAINNASLDSFHCVHFSCHAYFNITDARKSAILLANSFLDAPTKNNLERYLDSRNGETHDLDKCLTLNTILSLKLDRCRLVTLSACETGLVDFNNSSDEYIGLSSGFLIAGSPAVVSSLWIADNLSTALLMIKFYENLRTEKSIALALNYAQKWLRDLTCEEFEALLAQYNPQLEKTFVQLGEDRMFAEEHLLQVRKRKPCPFANPYYWAAFTTIGI